jgi:hypothetical protein
MPFVAGQVNGAPWSAPNAPGGGDYPPNDNN